MTVIPSLLALLDQAHHLKQLPRTGWFFAGVSMPESVAAHTYLTALLALLLGDAINQDWSAHGLAAPLNMERVLRVALVHDLAESVLTDLPKRSVELLGQDVKHAAEEEAMAKLTANLPDAAALIQAWREYDNVATPEARLVKDADKLEMVHQALQYEQRGFSNLDDFWALRQWHYGISADLFDALCQQRGLIARVDGHTKSE